MTIRDRTINLVERSSDDFELKDDLVLLTKGDQQGVSGRTNAMQILTVPGAAAARSSASA